MSALPESYPTRYWHLLSDERVQCDVCPRYCQLREGQRGLCFVRGCDGRRDPPLHLRTIQRLLRGPHRKEAPQPLSARHPGAVLRHRRLQSGLQILPELGHEQVPRDGHPRRRASPQAIARHAAALGCRSVAYTYNDPVPFLEYARDTALACRELGVKNVAVTAGYVSPGAREDLFGVMDAANVDLKAFTDDFYHRLCGGHLAPVLETLLYLRHETKVWVELTTLIIPATTTRRRNSTP